MAKKEKAPKEPKKMKAKKPKLKKNKGPMVIEDIFVGILTFLLVVVGIGNLVLAAFIGYSYLKSKFNLNPSSSPAVSETAKSGEADFIDYYFVL